MTAGWSMISAQTLFCVVAREDRPVFRRNHARIRGLGRDRRCRAWTFSYPTDLANRAVCWLKSSVPARLQSDCCVSGVRGAGVVERRNDAVETSIDRFGGDYKSFDLKSGDGDDACKAACAADNKCRAWTYARPGYAGKEAHCFLKKDIKPPRRKAGFTSGVVR